MISFLVGGLCTLLALLGYRVYAACYSKYLKDRDEKDFETLFSHFGVAPQVTYSTLRDLAETVINEAGDVRELTLEALIPDRSASSIPFDTATSNTMPRILLIDEVDVFFQNEFFGSTHNPACRVHNDQTIAIMKHIWDNRDRDLTLNDIRHLEVYRQLVSTMIPDAFRLIDCEIVKMLQDVQNFQDPAYVVHEGKVGYKTLDSIDYKRWERYKTCFAHLHEPGIAAPYAEEQLAFAISCGAYSFAKILDKFQCILGVTGTLPCPR